MKKVADGLYQEVIDDDRTLVIESSRYTSDLWVGEPTSPQSWEVYVIKKNYGCEHVSNHRYFLSAKEAATAWKEASA